MACVTWRTSDERLPRLALEAVSSEILYRFPRTSKGKYVREWLTILLLRCCSCFHETKIGRLQYEWQSRSTKDWLRQITSSDGRRLHQQLKGRATKLTEP